MAIKRRAIQLTEQVQTTERLVYRLAPNSTRNKKPKPDPEIQILGVSASWLYKDLWRTVLSTALVVGLLIAIKLSHVLS